VSVHSDNLTVSSERSTPSHPLSYQLYLLDSIIICPKTSKSGDLIGFKSPKVILSNSYETESFQLPTFGVDTVDADDTESKNEMNDVEENDFIDFTFDLQSDSVVYDDLKHVIMKPFDPGSILRVNVSAEQLRIFTGLSSSELSEADKESQDLFYLAHFLKIQDIVNDSAVFAVSDVLPEGLFSKRKHLTRLCTRRWREVTTENPVQLEVFADFVPKLRILIKDQITFDEEGAVECAPFSVHLQMSQFYALLSMWYGNMQEMPIIFPYSLQDIVRAVEVPACPSNWPEYGTASFVERLSTGIKEEMELVVSMAKLSWRCSFDSPDYFSKPLGCGYMFDPMNDIISLQAESFLVKVDFDKDQVMRIGCASGDFHVEDLRKNSTRFDDCFNVSRSQSKPSTIVDMNWGLDRGMSDFSDNLGSPFQLTVFMTPDRNCLVNVGFADLDSCTSDLAFFWILLEYFSSYFMYPEFGNPYFEAERKRVEYLKRCSAWTHDVNQQPCLNLDVRLWLVNPSIAIPSDSLDKNCSKLLLKSQLGGVSYRYRTIDCGFWSQNIITKSMEMLFLSNPISEYNLKELNNADKSLQILTRNLNIHIIYDMHVNTKHMNVSLSTLTSDHFDQDLDGIETCLSPAEPIILPEPTVCNPRLRLHKKWNRQSTCDIIVSPEHLKDAVGLLTNFVGPYPEQKDVDNAPECPDDEEVSFSVSARLCDFRFVICEPVLGMHLPIANIYISQIQCSMSDFKMRRANNEGSLDFQACADVQLWIDYYKSGPTRSWEPLLEPYKCNILYDKSSERGQGITVNSECPFHVNISGAFLETMDFATGALYTSIFRILYKEDKVSTPLSDSQQSFDFLQGRKMVKKVTEQVFCSSGYAIPVEHEKVLTLSPHERVAYSLINLSGYHLRFHQRANDKEELAVGYVEHLESTALSFPATRSIFRNLQVVEVSSDAFEDERSPGNTELDSSHYIDVQVPGMYWCHSICVDKNGKRFVSLFPRCDSVRVSNFLSTLNIALFVLY